MGTTTLKTISLTILNIAGPVLGGGLLAQVASTNGVVPRWIAVAMAIGSTAIPILQQTLASNDPNSVAAQIALRQIASKAGADAGTISGATSGAHAAVNYAAGASPLDAVNIAISQTPATVGANAPIIPAAGNIPTVIAPVNVISPPDAGSVGAP